MSKRFKLPRGRFGRQCPGKKFGVAAAVDTCLRKCISVESVAMPTNAGFSSGAQASRLPMKDINKS